MECYWILESDVGSSSTERILPDGRPELIVHSGDPSWHLDANNACWAEQGAVLFAGQLSSPLLLRPGASAMMIGARFRANGAAGLLPDRVQHFTGRVADLESEHATMTSELQNRIAEAQSDTNRVEILDRFLKERLVPFQIDPLVVEAIRRINVSTRGIKISSIPSELGISERQFERRFLSSVGLGPKHYLRTIRFQQSLQEMSRTPMAPLSEIALAQGYFDQSHFNREFRRFSGLSPLDYQSGVHAMNDLFS